MLGRLKSGGKVEGQITGELLATDWSFGDMDSSVHLFCTEGSCFYKRVSFACIEEQVPMTLKPCRNCGSTEKYSSRVEGS